MRKIYSVLMVLLTPLLLVRLWFKGRRLPEYRKRIGERFALGYAEAPGIDIWVHAVSLGEVIAATPLIDACLEKGYKLLITTMTPTGSRQVINRFGSKVLHCYAPYDMAWVVRRFFNRIKPKVGVIMETELWPNLFAYAKKSGVALYLVNARLSERSYQGYAKARFLFKDVLADLDFILAQSEDDAGRFIALGAEKEKVKVLGNIKFDLPLAAPNHRFDSFKSLWGSDRLVLIAASTHDNEEEQILDAFPNLLAQKADALLILVPRHPERFGEVHELAKRKGFTTGLRSNNGSISTKTQVLVVDAMGELLGWYALSDYAFVGGSFVPVGGHNVLEPIAMKVPVLTGPQFFNFQTICRDLLESEALVEVPDATNLMRCVVEYSTQPEARNKLIENATALLVKNRGVLEKYLQEVTATLS